MVSREPQGARILSVDVGSSSVRAELYDEAGNGVEGTEVKLDYEFEYTPDGGAEKDADELLDLVVRAVDGTLSEAGGAKISGVAMSTFWHSVLGLDRDGRPTTPILTWADRRAAVCVPNLRERLDERANHRRTGCVPHSSYWPAKLLWSSCAMPGAFEKTERWVSPADYFYARFFGEPYQVGTSMASGTGLFDQNRRKWDRKTLEALPAEESQLSAISDEPRRGLAREWAERWPALQEAPWLPAVGDGACSNVGSGCTGSDRLALMVGTSGAMRVLWKAESVEIPDGPWCYRADAERYVMGGALSDGGNLIEWLRNTLRLPDPEKTEEMLATASPGEKEVVASGGGLLNSPTWTRIIADTLGRPVTISGVREASSRGAALIALEALGGPEIEAADVPLGETFEPDPGRHEVYRRALERQRRLYDAVIGGS